MQYISTFSLPCHVFPTRCPSFQLPLPFLTILTFQFHWATILVECLGNTQQSDQFLQFSKDLCYRQSPVQTSPTIKMFK